MKLRDLLFSEAPEGGDGGGGGSTLMTTPAPEPATPAPAAQVEPTPEPTPTPAPYKIDLNAMFEPTGQFQKGWASQLGDGFVDHAPTLERFKDLPSLASSYMEAKKALSQKALSYPGEDATDEQRAEWNKPAGVAESVEQYRESRWGEDAQGLEDFKAVTGIGDEQLDQLLKDSIEAGVPARALGKQLETFAALSKLQAEEIEAQHALTQEDARSQLQEMFGDDTNAKIQSSIQAMDRVAEIAKLSPETVQALKENPNFGGNPDVVRLFAAVADSISSAAYKGHGLGTDVAQQFRSPMDHANDIMNNPENPLHEKYLAGDIKANAKVDALLAEHAKSQ